MAVFDTSSRGRERPGEARNAALSLAEPPLTPPGVMHYEPGPLTLRQFNHNGAAWLAVYEAQHDGRGWLVMRALCRPLVLMAGDALHLRAELVGDKGDVLEVAFDGPGKPTKFVPRSAVVFIEERARAGPGRPAEVAAPTMWPHAGGAGNSAKP